MSQYVTNTSDKKQKTALRWWRIGFLGLFGFEYFYVGKVKSGIFRLILGLGLLSAIAEMLGTPDAFGGVIVWPIIALPNWYRIKMGTFRDNVGNVLRE